MIDEEDVFKNRTHPLFFLIIPHLTKDNLTLHLSLIKVKKKENEALK